MPAFVQDVDGEALAVKVVSLFPGQSGQGLGLHSGRRARPGARDRPARRAPRRQFTDRHPDRGGRRRSRGYPFPARKHSLAVFGAGAQGRTQLEAACTVREIETAWIYDADPQRAARRLVAELAGHGPIPRDLRVALFRPGGPVRDADIICTATTSLTPVFADADLDGRRPHHGRWILHAGDAGDTGGNCQAGACGRRFAVGGPRRDR